MRSTHTRYQVWKFILLALLITAGRVFDIYTTFLYTPDLKNETNVIVVLFSAGWSTVLIVQSSLLLICIGLLYFLIFRFKPTYPQQKNLSFAHFVSYLCFNDTSSFKKLLYRVPANKEVLLASTAYVVSGTLIVVSFIVGASTSMLLISENYGVWYRQGIRVALFVLTGFAAIYFTIQFFRHQYKKYRAYAAEAN